jgi:hypothetical protein
VETLQNFRKDHLNFQRFTWIVTLGALGLAGFIYWDSQNKIAKSQITSYVSVDGRPYPIEQRLGLNYPERIYEYETMAKLFYVLHYSSDEASRKDNLESSLHFVQPGPATDKLILKYENEQIEKNVKEDGWWYQATPDSVVWDIWNEQGRVLPKPWTGYIFGKQKINMGRRKITRKMVIRFQVSDMPSGVRKPKNSFAAELNDVEVYNNELIQTD